MRSLACVTLSAALVAGTWGQGAVTGQTVNVPDRKVVGAGVRVITPGPLPHTGRPTPTLAALEMRIPELALDDVPFQTALSTLAEVTGANITADWRALEGAGVTRDTPITIRVRHVPLRMVLFLILQQASGDTELAYEARTSLIYVSTRDVFDKQLIVRTYDVADLVAIEPVYPAFGIEQVRTYISGLQPVVGNSAALPQPIIGEIRSGIRSGDPHDPNGTAAPQTDPDYSRRKMEELVRVITRVVEPNHWDVNGGPGSIATFRNQLIIRASPLVHQMIGGPLRDE